MEPRTGGALPKGIQLLKASAHCMVQTRAQDLPQHASAPQPPSPSPPPSSSPKCHIRRHQGCLWSTLIQMREEKHVMSHYYYIKEEFEHIFIFAIIQLFRLYPH